jgi:DNA polymerase-3 subunit beta
MITKTIFAISTEESRFTLNGALLLLRPDGMTMVSTDGHRLAYVESAAPVEGITHSFRALLPKKAMSEIIKLSAECGADAKVAVAGDENHLFFRFQGRLLITRRLTGSFPDYDRVLPKDSQHTVILRTAEIRSAIDRVGQFADERSGAIRVNFSPGDVKVFSSSSDTGESEESVLTDYDGPEIEIGFNAHYLLDFLRVVPEETVRFELKDQKNAGEMRPGGEGSACIYRYVVMPMRI